MNTQPNGRHPQEPPLIHRISVRNWQSLVSVDLTPGRFTVIVGPSSSGKSALIRALRAAASNVRGSAHITRGAKSAAISIDTEHHLITLERDPTAGRYRLLTRATGAEDTFTKLAGGVPDQITAALRIQPAPPGVHSINFASQFDPPFLLTDTGPVVARALGELTAVDKILEAVRIAHRYRHQLASERRTRETDLVGLKTQIARYAGLPGVLTRLEHAEAVHARIGHQHQRVTRLAGLIDTLDQAAAIPAPTPPVGDMSTVMASYARHQRFTQLLHQWLTNHRDADAHVHTIADCRAVADRLQEQVHQTLIAAGVCPTCGQNTRNH